MVTSPGARYSYCDCLPIIKVAVGNSAESDHGLDASSLRSSLAATALHSLVQTPTRVLLRVSVGGGRFYALKRSSDSAEAAGALVGIRAPPHT